LFPYTTLFRSSFVEPWQPCPRWRTGTRMSAGYAFSWPDGQEARIQVRRVHPLRGHCRAAPSPSPLPSRTPNHYLRSRAPCASPERNPRRPSMGTLVKILVTFLVLAGFVYLRVGRLVERRRAFGRPELPGHMPLLAGVIGTLAVGALVWILPGVREDPAFALTAPLAVGIGAA